MLCLGSPLNNQWRLGWTTVVCWCVCGLTISCVASDTDISAHRREGDGRFVLDGSWDCQPWNAVESTMAGEGVVRERAAGGWVPD